MEKSPHPSCCLLYYSICTTHCGLLLYCVQYLPVYKTLVATPDKNGCTSGGETVNEEGDWKAQQYWNCYWNKQWRHSSTRNHPTPGFKSIFPLGNVNSDIPKASATQAIFLIEGYLRCKLALFLRGKVLRGVLL
jgi:hypothetical protein